MIAALRAIAAWHENRKDAKHEVSSDLRDIYERVDQIAQTSFGEVKVQAEKAQATFYREK